MKVQYKKEKAIVLQVRQIQKQSTHSVRRINEQNKIALPTIDGLCFEKTAEILYLSADSNYTMIYFQNNRQILVCKTLKEVEAIINQHQQFIRIHRSHTINLNFLQKYLKSKGGQVVLDNGTVLNISAGQKQHFLAAIAWYFNF